MIAPEYFNNHIAIEGEIIVKGVPNDTGYVLVWNPVTKKISRRTHAEIVSDLNVMTTNTVQDVGGRKIFYVSGDSNPEDTNLWTYGVGGAKAGIVFYSSGMDVGKINFDGYFHFKNSNDTGYKKIVSAGHHLAENGSISKLQNNTKVFHNVYQGYEDNVGFKGVLSIKFPQVSTAQTMFMVDINLYGYNQSYLGKAQVSFYKYFGNIIPTGSRTVLNVSDNFPTDIIRVGIDGAGMVSICFGDHTTFWDGYIGIEVERVQTQYGVYNEEWSYGWTHALEDGQFAGYPVLTNIITDRFATREWLGNGFWKKEDIAGIYWGLRSNRDVGVLTPDNQAQRMLTGGLLASYSYDHASLVPGNGAYIHGVVKTGSHFEGVGMYSPILNGSQVFNTSNTQIYFGNPSVSQVYLESGNDDLFHNRTGWGIARIWDQHNFNPNNYIPTSHPVYGITSAEINDWRHFGGYWDNRNIQPVHLGTQRVQIGFTAWNNDNSYPWADYIHFGGYQDGSGGNQNLMVIKKNGFGLRQFQGSPQGVSSYQSYVDYWNTADFTSTDVQNWKNNAGNIVIVNEQDAANLFTKENKFMWINGSVSGAGGINSWVGNFISIGGNNQNHKSQLLISKNQLLFRGNHGNEDTAFNEVWHNLNLSKDEFVGLDNGRSSRAITGKDLNNLRETGFFRGSNLGNAPMGSPEWFFITSEYHYTGWVSQTASTYGTGASNAQANRIFKRTLIGDSYWTDWVEIITTANLTNTQNRKRTYFWQSDVYSGTIVNRIYLPTHNVADVTIKIGSSYHSAYAIGLIELELVYGINAGGGPWGAEAQVREAFGALVERIYVDPTIKYDSDKDRPYINVHKFHPADNPIFIDVTVRSYSNDLKDDSVFFEEDTKTPVLDLKNQSFIISKLDSKANVTGDNATDTWRRDSLGLYANPSIPGKTKNGGGDTSLQEATHGSVAGYLNSAGTYNGNPNNNWWFRIKMLHDNSSGYHGEIGVQMTGGFNALSYRRMENGTDYGWVQVWDSQNFNPNLYITQSSVNSQLSGYAALNGVQTFTNTNTFAQSPVIPNGTLGAHAVNVSQLNGKANALENATGIGFSSGNYPSADGSQYPYIYFNNGGTQDYIALATQAYLQANFLSTPNGTSVLISGSDLNNYLKTGFYRGSGLVNAPLHNSGWWYLSVETHDSAWVKQTATSYGSGNTPNIMYQRTMVGGKWTAWVQIWTTADFNLSNIQQWNYAYQYGLKLNEEFTVNQNTGLVLADNYFGGESGIIDHQMTRLLAAKRDEYYFYGSVYDNFDGLNFYCKDSLFGMGMPANGKDKLTVNGAVKAYRNFKSEKERPDTLFIPNGELADLRDEIINDESDYSIRLDPHEYEIDQSGYLEVNDRNRLIHIIGEQYKSNMIVNFREIYPKQQIVIYNFDKSGNAMEVRIHDNKVYYVEPNAFLRLYITRSLRVIAERQMPCEIIW